MAVYLVGAGPGDPGLLTVKGAELLRRADVVVHDRLSELSLLDQARPDAELIDVGKRPGQPVAQEYINELLITRGRAGATVVRLKGGDPFVFGRGGEEALALIEAKVPFEVVPGITSAVAVPAYAGIPVTHRGLATSFTVVTGHSRHAVEVETNWEALAAAGGTIVVLMGVAHRTEIAARLQAGGLSPSTPVAAVRWGSRPGQSTVRTTLAGLGDVPLEPPVTVVIGAVAALELGWFEQRPLFGRRVVVTRSREQASDLVSRLVQLGAETVELPTIAIADPGDGGDGLRAAAEAVAVAGYRWVVFTSANAVHRFVPLVRDARSFAGASIAATGPGTAEALARYGLVADLVPERFVAEALVEALGSPATPGRLAEGRRVLLPRAAVGRDALPDGLRAAGWEVDVVEAYRTVAATPSAAELAAVASADVVTFTSSSTVTNFVALVGADRLPPIVACIGPVTAATARDLGIEVQVIPEEHTIAGLVDAVVAATGQREIDGPAL
jgi:uroporphyrinogen III methyltransferase/synthase